MIKNHFYPVLIAILCLTFSCQDEYEEVSQEEQSINLPQDNDMLKFDSWEHFREVADHFSSNPNEFNKWLNENQNHNSILTEYNRVIDLLNDVEDESKFLQIVEANEHVMQIIRSGDEQELVRITEDDYLAAFSNADGLIQIANEVYLTTYDFMYKASVENKKLFTLARREMNENIGSAISALPIERTLITDGPSLNNGRQQCDKRCENNYDRRRRLVGNTTKIRIQGLFGSVTIKTRHQKRSARIWFANKPQSISMGARGTVFGRVIDYSNTKTDDAELSRTYTAPCLPFDPNCNFTPVIRVSTSHSAFSLGAERRCITCQ